MGKTLEKKIRSRIFIIGFSVLEDLKHEGFELFETDFLFITHKKSSPFKTTHQRT